MSNCPDPFAFVEDLVGEVETQYRESPNLLAMMRHGLRQIHEVVAELCSLPEKFNLLTAVGDQLTILGRRLGWPRCHCVCEPAPVFGFACGPTNPNQTIVGFCEEGTWGNCQQVGGGTLCFNDDETYRRYLLARRFQMLQLYGIDDLQAAAQHIWGETATAISMGDGKAAVSPGRGLTTLELRQLPLAFRVLPFAPGIETFVSYQTGPVAGFGDGWAGFCGGEWFCPEKINPYECA